MENEKYEKKIAQLESLNDQLQAEFTNLDLILRELGFEKGILTLKEAAKEMLNNKNPLEETDDSSPDEMEF
jgi:hypothetical protein